MSKTIRLLSLLLALLMVASTFLACGQNTEDPGSESGSSTIAATEEETNPVEEALNALRGEVDWGGNDFGIIYVNDIGGYTEEVEAEPESGDVSNSSLLPKHRTHLKSAFY